MAEMKMAFSVYIMTNRSGTLYVGVSNDLGRRVQEHKTGHTQGFTSRFRMDRLVYFETTSDINVALAREKQLKGWRRSKKIALIEALNPNWDDLADSVD